ncbi:MAG TPA: hypothetical protein VF614_12660 [Chthoniobacteraceae bacterium]|jgi:hypothetical protein
MASKSAPPVPSSLVAKGVLLIAEAEQITLERDAIALRLKQKDSELQAINEQLIALGRGRYCDPDATERTCTVVAGVDPELGPDTFRIKSAEDEARARALAGADFLTLFKRHVWYAPREDFRGLVKGRLTPKKQEELLQLCIVPGQLQGGRKAYVRWK